MPNVHDRMLWADMSQGGGRETKELPMPFWQRTILHYPILWILIDHSRLTEI